MKKILAIMSALAVLLSMTACEKNDSSEKASSSIAETAERNAKSDGLIEKKIDNFCFAVPNDAEEKKSYSEVDKRIAYYYYYTNWGMICISYSQSDEIISWHSDAAISGFYNGLGETIEILSDEKVYIDTAVALKFKSVSHYDEEAYLSTVCVNTLNGNIVFSVASYVSTENAEYHYKNLKEYFKFDRTADSVDIPQATTTTKVTTTKATTTVTTTEKPQVQQVLYDNNGLKITYKGLTKKKVFTQTKTEINVLIENSSDKNYTVQVRDFSVNGFMVDHVFSSDVASGKKINDSISVYDDKLAENGITECENVEFTFYVFNADDWTDSFESGVISISEL